MRACSILMTFAVFCCEIRADDVGPRQVARTVYIVSMANELDQYLASRLTSGHVLRVVLEPARADVVLTDKLDRAFWAWMALSYPGHDRPSHTDIALRKRGSANKSDQGTVFLVDSKAKVVLWSTTDHGRTTSPDDLDRVAGRIAKRLRTSMYEK